MLATIRRQIAVVGVREVVVEIVDVAFGGHVEAAEDVEERRLPAPRCAEEHDELTAIEIEVDPAESDDVDLAHPIDLAKPSRRENGIHGDAPSVSREVHGQDRHR